MELNKMFMIEQADIALSFEAIGVVFIDARTEGDLMSPKEAGKRLGAGSQVKIGEYRDNFGNEIDYYLRADDYGAYFARSLGNGWTIGLESSAEMRDAYMSKWFKICLKEVA